jgi:hypothetical protein
MNNFGKIKTKILKKLTESYSSQNKNEIKNILKLIKENKEFKDLYLFYEEIENKYISDKETAKLYVEGLSTLLNQSMSNSDLTNFCESLNESLVSVESVTNELYESLDVLSEKDTLSNIEKKVVAKKSLVEHLTTKKQIEETKNTTHTSNENLLHTVLTNNFNVLFDNTLNEEQKSELKNILSLSNDELEIKTSELREGILNKVETLLSESTNDEFNDKLNQVKGEIMEMELSKYNYYKLTQLKEGLN